MRVLELYSGNKPLTEFFRGMGFECFSGDLKGFSVGDYPEGPNRLDLLFININYNGFGFSEGLDRDEMLYGLDLLEHYNPKYWVILNNEVDIFDDIMMWGIPYKNLDFIRGGAIIHARVWNNIFKWVPKHMKLYINPKLLMFEILGYIHINYTQPQNQNLNLLSKVAEQLNP